MLNMHIITWEPAQRDEVIKRAQTMGIKYSEGTKLIGFWIDLHGCRAFELTDGPPPDPKGTFEASFAWNDLVKIEVVPVMEYEEVMKLLPDT